MPTPFDPFFLLGVPRTFDLSIDQVRGAHLALAASLHPDLAPGESEEETSRRSAELNLALHLLEDPERRANVLLELLGGPTKEQDRSLPPGFLMEMMETREAIESAVESADPAAIRTWHDWAEEQRAGHIRAISDLFRGLPASAKGEQLAPIRTRLNEWRYIERLREQLDSGGSASQA